MPENSKVAWSLAHEKIDKKIAVLGPKILSEIYDFDIIDENLQDQKDNSTTFLVVKN